jgi:hypothetical protein
VSSGVSLWFLWAGVPLLSLQALWLQLWTRCGRRFCRPIRFWGWLPPGWWKPAWAVLVSSGCG